jgi:hypothetical protein
MLAKRRTLRVRNAPIVSTPLLLPSFSSKGFPKIAKILQAMEEYISDEILVSAYDVHYSVLIPPFDFASTIFLDSGVYEASRDAELSETFDREHITKAWSPEQYNEVISTWTSTSPTIFVSFDHAKYRASTEEQIKRANEMR